MKRLAAVLAVILILLLAVCFFLPKQKAAEQAETGAEQPLPTASQTCAGQLPSETVQQETTLPPEPEDGDFVRVADYIPGIRSELAYATVNNFTGQQIYEFTDACLRFGTVKKLASAAELLAQQGYGLVIWDGYRPVYAQEKLWEICPDPTYVSQPGTGSQSHCRGIAVDVTLYDLQSGALLEMPTGFDDFTAKADRDYGDCTAEAAKNAALLEDIMERCGFKPYSAEWWHYSDTDSYPVEYEFDPANVT